MAAFGVVVLMGILALAFDLGFSWMLHRKEQNAVDPAAIAAARWLKEYMPSLRQRRVGSYPENERLLIEFPPWREKCSLHAP